MIEEEKPNSELSEHKRDAAGGFAALQPRQTGTVFNLIIVCAVFIYPGL